jgi:hypothetical protein
MMNVADVISEITHGRTIWLSTPVGVNDRFSSPSRTTRSADLLIGSRAPGISRPL